MPQLRDGRGFPAAEQWLKKAELIPETDGATSQARVPLDPKERDAVFQEFADYLRAPRPQQAAVHLEPLQREALFQQFADYLRTPRPQNAAVYPEPEQREALFQQFAEYQKRQYLMIASRYQPPIIDRVVRLDAIRGSAFFPAAPNIADCRAKGFRPASAPAI